MFSDILKDEQCSPFSRMKFFEIIQDDSSSYVMPRNVKNYFFGAPS